MTSYVSIPVQLNIIISYEIYIHRRIPQLLMEIYIKLWN